MAQSLLALPPYMSKQIHRDNQSLMLNSFRDLELNMQNIGDDEYPAKKLGNLYFDILNKFFIESEQIYHVILISQGSVSTHSC